MVKIHFITLSQEDSIPHAEVHNGPIKLGMDINEDTIGSNIRRLRGRAKLTRAQLAQRVGLDEQSIKKFENGENVKQWLRVAQLAEALQASPNELLGFSALSSEALESALKPILAAYGANPDDADSIARILLEAVEVAQASPDEGPVPLRYKMAGQLAAARSRAR